MALEQLNLNGSIGFILNTNAANNDILRDAIDRLREALVIDDSDWHVYVEVAWEYSQLAEKVTLLRDRGVTLIVAVGGDGTLNGVSSTLHQLRSDIEMAILPEGTANDFAHFIGIADLTIEDALEKVLKLKAHPIDLGYVVTHDRFFLNVATAGFGAQVTVLTPSDLKRRIGGFAYLVSGLQNITELSPFSIEIEANGITWTQPTLGFAIGNGAQTGGGFQVCRKAKLNDGLLDLVVAPAMPLATMREYFFGDLTDSDEIVYGRVKYVEIKSEDQIQMNLDGEPIVGDFFRIEVVEQALRLRCDIGNALQATNDGSDASDE